MSQAAGSYITSGKGFHITFANGWTVSVQFAGGNYCENRDDPIGHERDEWPASGKKGCRDAEVAAWGPDGEMIRLGDDTVRGWQSPADVLALLNAAANGDLTAGKIPATSTP